MGKMNRRSFLKISAVLGVDILGAGILSCQTQNDDEKKNKRLNREIYTRESDLSKLLICGSPNDFSGELNRVLTDLKIKYGITDKNYNFQKRRFNYITKLFKDKNLVMSYLDGNESFLRESLLTGHFLYAYGATQKMKIDERKTRVLKETADFQKYITGYDYGLILGNQDDSLLIRISDSDITMRLMSEVEELQINKNNNINEKYGESKKRILELAEQRFKEYSQMYPDSELLKRGI